MPRPLFPPVFDMPDISDLTATVARDPLAPVLALFVLGGFAAHFLFRNYPVGRAIVRVVFLVFLTIAFVRADIVPYQPLRSTGTPLLDAVHGVLKIAWWVWAAWFLVGFLRAFVIVERRPRESKLLQDLIAGLIYLAAAFAIISYVFDLPIQGLLATSGVVAVILGLALQSSLGDVFSGIVLNFSRPYLPGDWVNIDGGTEGRVIEMNWRATHVLTGKRDLAIVPNSTIAKSKIVNVSSPSGIHGVTVTLHLNPRTPPSTGSEILKNAMLNCRLIVATPAPSVVVKSVTGSSTEFEVTFFVEELASSTNAQNQLFDLIFRHLAASAIELASPPSQLPASEADESSRMLEPAAERVLRLVSVFATLTSDERKAVTAKLEPGSYDQGDRLVEPGKVLNSLFIIGSGVLSVTRGEIDGETEVARLGPGDYYGDIGMLTGSPATSTITALMPALVYELAKDDLAPILKARPQVAHELSCAMAQRQAIARLTASAEVDESVATNRLTTWFSERLHRLYDVANAR
jgi:small-conductance mechanosensitive channel/CRP-like cAMP-binding protein